MKRLLVALGWFLALGWTPGALAADPPRCLRLYSEDLADLAAPERRQVLRAVKAYDRAAQDGVEFFLQYREVPDDGMQRLHQALQNFRYQNTVPNPFANDRDLMAALARVDQSNPGVQNYGRVLGDLGQENALGLSQAAAFDIYVADDATRAGLGVEGFQIPLGAGGVTRFYDVKTRGGRYLENKSLVVPYSIQPGELTNPAVSPNGLLFVYQDGRLTQLADETARSIVLHVGDGYELFGTNFRNLPQMVAQRGDIEAVMLKQFESGLVQQALDPAAVQTARTTFTLKLATILQFK